MRYLLDTHTLLWFLANDRRLSRHARRLIESSNNDRLLSVASLWEIAIKVRMGKLEIIEPLDRLFPKQLHLNRIEMLHITVDSLVNLTTLPFYPRQRNPHDQHTDPFDRLIIAQALVENISIIGVDSDFDAYGVIREWSE
ncbi:MAG: type II toxin-antitoxin system VapC family toxin [Candidatus Poribacteria bacterium]|nr:type II toxin-antitoxin system VapC family toxin [Candidatus Poribacteria bacterium]